VDAVAPAWFRAQRHRTPANRRKKHGKSEEETTALLVIDPYNDFVSEGGKVWDRLRGVAEANGCGPHMLQVLNAARIVLFRWTEEASQEAIDSAVG
jgi:hypothetical protein